MKVLTRTTFLLAPLVFIIAVACNRPGSQQAKEDKKDNSMITVEQEDFGHIGNEKVKLYTLANKNGMIVKITNYGGIVTSIEVPDSTDKMYDVVLGFDSLRGYLDGHPYFGCLVGRYANRIANGEFTLNGETYSLARNNGQNHLHGGNEGFDKKIWTANPFESSEEAGLELNYVSHDGEEGYPGELEVKVIYALTNDNELKIKYYAFTGATTVINLTNHCYFNLNGQGEGDILNHLLYLNANKYTPVDENLIPTGELRDVAGSPFDFRQEKPIGKDIGLVPGGYDNNFVLNHADSVILAARLISPSTGIELQVYTDQPGIQFYSGNFLDGSIAGKDGKVYDKHYGLCLETQHFPDSPNQPGFPSTVLEPGEVYETITVYKFSN